LLLKLLSKTRNMRLSPLICVVLVCLQLWTIHGQADMQLVKIARNSRMRDALLRVNGSLREATRRDGRDLTVKSNIFPVTVDLTTILNDINARFQTLTQSQAQMKTQISGMEDSIEALESDVERAKSQISEQSTTIDKLTQDINEKIANLEKSLEKANCAKFVFVNKKVTNAEAEAACVKQGGHLASLDTDAKIDCVKEHVIPKNNKKAWLGADCVGCADPSDDKWQWKSGSKLGLHHPLWAKNYGKHGHDLPYDDFANDAMHLTMRCD